MPCRHHRELRFSTRVESARLSDRDVENLLVNVRTASFAFSRWLSRSTLEDESIREA